MKKTTMSVKVIFNTIDVGWNKVAPHPLQSLEWGEARAKTGIDVVRIGEFSGEKLQNVFQTTFHRIPYTSFTIGYLPRSVVPSEEVINLLVEEGKKRKAIFIKIEPYVKEISNFKFQISNLIKSPHPLFPSWTQMIDLTKSEEELLRDMKSKTRYNIRLAEKKGVEVREMSNREGFEIFARLYFETCRRQQYKGHTNRYHKIVFESLKEKIAHIFIAFYKDTPLASYELFTFNDVLYYPYGGSLEQYRNLMATNLLMWEAIRFGKKSGCKLFDMWGSLPPNSSENRAWEGFTRFKEGYGTDYVEFVGSYDLVINKSVYFLYGIADNIRKRSM